MNKEEMIQKLIEQHHFRKMTENCVYYIGNIGCIIVMFCREELIDANIVVVFADIEEKDSTHFTFWDDLRTNWKDIYQYILARF